ncbi:flagellar biosynthesis protein FliQ [Micromonospora vinacea]|uniref:Flagellar biosynthesis protein FliQ n=1 Tax=Micromonospora vinacea TaxID=709878 RepID=A0ABS0JZB5_9ACTN|nr:FtsX-like permease family protein [Micromonospora vinacea]MBG6101713.1 flagellar biosynthesis protein FliQ [Micromonospora vinacea]
MRPTTLVRLALAGTRTDTARVVLTALSALLATLAGLAALTVLAIEKPAGDAWAQSEQYRNALLREPGLRGGTAFALLMLMVPVLALAGQCARLGAPARDRRLAAIRLAGATPGQVTRLVVLETGVAALLGTFVGLGVYLVGRYLLHRPDARGQLAVPTDVLPSPGALAGVVLGLPVVAALATALMLRTVTTSPLGVSRKAARERGPGPWAGLLIGFGVASFALIRPAANQFDDSGELTWLVPLLFAGGALAAMIGVVIGTGWISYHCGRLLRRHARRAPALLAAGRLMADPWAGSRTFAALLAALIFGGGAAAQRAYFATKDQLDREQSRLAGAGDGGANPFYLSTMDLVDGAIAVAILIATGGLIVALVEGIVARRRAYAALVATGVPRATLSRSVAWQALAPAVPAILLALTVGTLLGRGLVGEVSAGGGSTLVCDATAALCDDPATREQYSRIVYFPEVQRAVPVPLEHLAWLGAGALAAVLVTVGVGLLFLRVSTALDELRTT